MNPVTHNGSVDDLVVEESKSTQIILQSECVNSLSAASCEEELGAVMALRGYEIIAHPWPTMIVSGPTNMHTALLTASISSTALFTSSSLSPEKRALTSLSTVSRWLCSSFGDTT